jgi:hypothetical protein
MRAGGVEIPGLSLPARPPQLCVGCPHGDTIEALTVVFASDSPGFHDDLVLVDSTPVECARSVETTRRSQLADAADYGYVIESGRIVLDGDAAKLGEHQDIREFYLGQGGGERKSYRDVKQYKRSRRWYG